MGRGGEAGSNRGNAWRLLSAHRETEENQQTKEELKRPSKKLRPLVSGRSHLQGSLRLEGGPGSDASQQLARRSVCEAGGLAGGRVGREKVKAGCESPRKRPLAAPPS